MTARASSTRPRPSLTPNVRSLSTSLSPPPRLLGTNPKSSRRQSVTRSPCLVARGWWIRLTANFARYFVHRREQFDVLYWIACGWSTSPKNRCSRALTEEFLSRVLTCPLGAATFIVRPFDAFVQCSCVSLRMLTLDLVVFSRAESYCCGDCCLHVSCSESRLLPPSSGASILNVNHNTQ